MPDRYLYLLVDSLCLLFPLLLSFHSKIQFYRQWRHFILPCLVTSVVFIVWDIIFTAGHVWSFNDRYVLGIFFFGLPLEELLFFFCIPYACVFTYYTISTFFKVAPVTRSVKILTAAGALILMITGLYFLSRLYTSVTFILLSLMLMTLLYKKVDFLPVFFVSFLVTLIPFYLSNGVLTGFWTPEPVVSYNNAYNLGIRSLTIPIEDIFYSMALLLMNVSGFEYQRRRQRPGTVINRSSRS